MADFLSTAIIIIVCIINCVLSVVTLLIVSRRNGAVMASSGGKDPSYWRETIATIVDKQLEPMMKILEEIKKRMYP